MKCIVKKYVYLFFVIAFVVSEVSAQTQTIGKFASQFRVARLKYSGGGDWYNDPSAEPNLMRFVRSNTNIDVSTEYQWVDIASDDIFGYPFLYMTGHGNVELSDAEAKRLRAYLDAGGFLYADDDYGMDKSFRREMQKVFPEQQMQELPFDHPIFHTHFDFVSGVPKIHEHDNKPPQSFGLFSGKRLCVLYTFESNPSDGWADADVHNDPPEKRAESLRFGTNIVVHVLNEQQLQ